MAGIIVFDFEEDCFEEVEAVSVDAAAEPDVVAVAVPTECEGTCVVSTPAALKDASCAEFVMMTGALYIASMVAVPDM